MQQVTPFSTTIWMFNLGPHFDTEIELAYKIKERMPSVQRSNVGGYQSDFLNLIEEFPHLTKMLFPVLDSFCVQLKMQGSVNGAWLNINPKHSHNLCHTHPQSTLSGVMYLSTNKQSGDIVFYNPAPVEHYPSMDGVQSFPGQYVFSPENGDVLVFPSYLEHCVMPNLSDTDRISIGFNIV